MEDEDIGTRLKRLRLEVGLSKRELARRAGVDRVYITQIEGRKVKSITLRMARALAKGLGRPPEVFFGSSPSPSRALSDLEQSIKAYIPVYSKVSAGSGTVVDYVACTRAKAAPETLRAYRVKGLCLSSEISEGDTLVVDTALSPIDGDLVVVLIDDQASVKRYKEDAEGKKWLENNSGVYQLEDVVLHGVVVGFYRSRR